MARAITPEESLIFLGIWIDFVVQWRVKQALYDHSYPSNYYKNAFSYGNIVVNFSTIELFDYDNKPTEPMCYEEFLMWHTYKSTYNTIL